MNKEDKASITHNLTALIETTQFTSSLEVKLVEKEVFKEDMLDRIKCGALEDLGRKRSLYKEVQTRGPLAFQSLVQALAESDNLRAAEILDPGHLLHLQENSDMEVDRNLTKVWNSPNYGETLSQPAAAAAPLYKSSFTPLQVNVRKSNSAVRSASQIKSYKMTSNPRGQVLIINNEQYINDVLPKRTGSLVDANNLDLLFLQLGFNVSLRSNLVYQDMFTEIQRFAERQEHEDCDMAVVVIMSHGRQGLVAACDGREIETEWIMRQFNNLGCPALRGKPKLFVFQACRGEDHDFGAPVPRIDFEQYEGPRGQTDARSINPTVSSDYKDVSWEDMIVAYATLPGYVANRDKYRGTWFIESLCQVFMDNAAELEIREMLDKVGETLRNFESEFRTKQSFAYEVRHFYKKLYFNP